MKRTSMLAAGTGLLALVLVIAAAPPSSPPAASPPAHLAAATEDGILFSGILSHSSIWMRVNNTFDGESEVLVEVSDPVAQSPWRFYVYLFSPEGNYLYYWLTGLLPVHRSAVEFTYQGDTTQVGPNLGFLADLPGALDGAVEHTVRVPQGESFLLVTLSHYTANVVVRIDPSNATSIQGELVTEDANLFRTRFTAVPGDWKHTEMELWTPFNGFVDANTEEDVGRTHARAWLFAPGEIMELSLRDSAGRECRSTNPPDQRSVGLWNLPPGPVTASVWSGPNRQLFGPLWAELWIFDLPLPPGKTAEFGGCFQDVGLESRDYVS